MIRLKIIEAEPWTLDAAADFNNKRIHLVCIAINALTIYNCYATAVGGMNYEDADEYARIANNENKTITLYPKLNMSIIPISIYANRNEFNDREVMHKNIMDVFDLNEEKIKSHTLIFALERRYEYNIDLALEILNEINLMYDFKETKSILFYKK